MEKKTGIFDCIAIGRYCMALEDHCIALGSGAKAEKPYEFALKGRGFSYREIMTPEEFEVISKFLKRMLLNDTVNHMDTRAFVMDVGKKMLDGSDGELGEV